MTLFWTRTWDALAGALFPTACVSCGRLISAHDPPLCQTCWGHLDLLDHNRCRCGTPLPGSPDEECGRCRRGRSLISLGASLGPYGGPLRDCVVALKYKGRHKTAERLAIRLLEDARCGLVLRGANAVMGVPLHAKKLRERGFNQADLLAQALSRGSGVFLSRGLVRLRNTPSQTSLSIKERRLNVRNAFAVRPDPVLQNAVVVLVDDVTTTGATIRECAATLLNFGVREVRSITVARAE